MKIRSFTEEELRSYREHGAAYIPALVDEETVAALLAIATDEKRPQGKYKNALSQTGSFFEERFLYPAVGDLEGYVLNKTIGKNIGAAMQSDSTRVLFDHLFCCGPNTPVDYYWHQDLSYWPIDGEQICTVWLALTDCDTESGALEIVLNSDKDGIYAIRPFGDEDFGEEVKANYDAGAIPRYEEHRERYDFLRHPLTAGDAYLFNAKVMHASAGNRSTDRQRVAYAIRYIGDDVVWHPRPAFDQEALTPKGRMLQVGEKFAGEEFPLIWQRRETGVGDSSDDVHAES